MSFSDILKNGRYAFWEKSDNMSATWKISDGQEIGVAFRLYEDK